MITTFGNHTVLIRGADIPAFFKVRRAYVNGSFANGMQANVGEILARIASIRKGGKISIALKDKVITLEIAGVIKARTQSDVELIVPISVANLLMEDGGKVSIIEFAAKTGRIKESRHISELMPAGVRMIAIQQTETFVKDINDQTLYFLSL